MKKTSKAIKLLSMLLSCLLLASVGPVAFVGADCQIQYTDGSFTVTGTPATRSRVLLDVYRGEERVWIGSVNDQTEEYSFTVPVDENKRTGIYTLKLTATDVSEQGLATDTAEDTYTFSIYDVESFTLTDESGKKTAKATVTNYDETAITPALVIASYEKGGALYKVATAEPKAIEKNQSAELTIELAAGDIPADGTVHAFIWKDLTSMTPLAQKR